MFLRIEKSVFVLISLSFVFTAGNDILDESDHEAQSDRQGLWFGPRLGKRSLRAEDDNRDLYLRMMEAAEAMKYYYNQLPVSVLQRSEPDNRGQALVTKKVIFTPKLGRSLEEERGINEFTPRLGRRVVEETGNQHDSYKGDESTGSRVRFFSPRLGRTMNFSPRLGRELTYDDYPSVRVARSVNKTTNSQN